MKRFLSLILIGTLLFPSLAFAQQTSVLPEAGTDCESLNYESPSSFKNLSSQEKQDEFLGCAVKLGKIKLWMIPFFVRNIANFLIGIAGTISVLFVLLGGFWYMTGGLTDDKEKGKKTIMYALIGLVITLLGWIIVNIVMVQVTG